MSAKSNNIRIGIFVMIAIFLLIVGLLAFGAKGFFARKDTLETAIEDDVSGLSVGSKVLFRGVPVGKVSNIDFARNLYPSSKSRMIVVEVEVERTIFVREQSPAEKEKNRLEEIANGLRAMVKSQGITGISILAVDRLDPKEFPPPPIDYTPRYPYIPSAPSQFTRMLESIEQSLHNIQKINMEGLGLGASNALAQTALLAESLNRLDLKTTVGKANTALDDVRITVRNIDTTIKSMKLDALSGEASELVSGLKESNAKLQTTLDQLGTVPMEKTVVEIHTAVQKLDDALGELKRYPAGFLFGEPPPPAKSVQPTGR